jgi:hypothetical protein
MFLMSGGALRPQMIEAHVWRREARGLV